MKRVVKTGEAPAAVGAYSQAIVAGGFVFTSGQVALCGGELLNKGSIEEETHQVMKNLGAILVGASVYFGDVVRATIYVTDVRDYGKINGVYSSYFPDTDPPARALVGVKELPLGARVEIDMIAVVPDHTDVKI